jgi:membrane protease YdiL (CAAX protease family)
MVEAMTLSLLAWFVVKRKKTSFWRAVALRRPRGSDIGYALLGVLAYVMLFILAITIVSALLPIDTEKEQAIGFEKGIGGIDLLLAFISLAVLPPIAEEIIFRGFFFGTLRSRNVRLSLAILITSLVFGTLHLFGAGDGSLLWIAFFDTFILSLALCYVREKTGSIWATIIMHALKNTFVFVNLFIIGGK